ncbi:MAG: VapE domain-containing protein [Methylococcales bacterium]
MNTNSKAINLNDCPEFPEPIGSTTPPKKPSKAKAKKVIELTPNGIKASKPINFDVRIGDFPHTKDNGQKNSSTANLRHLLNGYNIKVSYDEMLKEQKMVFGNEFDNAHGDLLASANLAELSSLVDINGLHARILNLLPAIFSSNAINPILDFIKSKEWDGVDRIIDLAGTLTVSDNDESYAYLALKTWLVQFVAAADGARHTSNKDAIAKYELVFILQGGQGARKTSWFQKLLPTELKQYILDGVHLDPANKDSVKQSVSYWICELGELDSTFRRADISQLKAFLSKQSDTLRLPYDKAACGLGRRVSFCGSVNPEMFLVDSTGNRRFLPVQIIACNSLHTIDMQQLWAQVWHTYLDGEQWWCSKELENLLEERHDRHAEINPIHELIAECFDIEKVEKVFESKHYNATRILTESGIKDAKPSQAKFVSEYLKKLGFERIQSYGIMGFWLAKRVFSPE